MQHTSKNTPSSLKWLIVITCFIVLLLLSPVDGAAQSRTVNRGSSMLVHFVQNHHQSNIPPSSITISLIEYANNMIGTKEEKASFLAKALTTSFIEYGAYNGQINPGFDPVEGLPEPTPHCKRSLHRWTRDCLFKKAEFPSPGISPGLDAGGDSPFDGGGGGGNGGGGAPGDELAPPGGGGGGGGSKCNGLIGAIVCLVKKVVKHVGKALFGFKQINGKRVLVRYGGSTNGSNITNIDNRNITNAWWFNTSPPSKLMNNNNNSGDLDYSNTVPSPSVTDNAKYINTNTQTQRNANEADEQANVIDDDKLIHAAMASENNT